MKRQFLSFTLLLALSTWIAQAATVRGTVSDTAGKPLQGVVVTDGYNFTQTNERENIARFESGQKPLCLPLRTG